MKNILLISCFLLFANLATAQVEYKIKYQKMGISPFSKEYDWGKNQPSKEILLLATKKNKDPNKIRTSVSEWVLTANKAKSSFINTKRYMGNGNGLKDEHSTDLKLTQIKFYKDWNEQNIFYISAEEKLWKSTIPIYDWEIDWNKTIDYLGYKVVKATSNIDNQNVIAWFAEDLPLAEGPNNIFGLPGIILKCRKGNFAYNAIDVQVSKKDTIEIDLPNTPPTLTNRQQWIESNKAGR